MPFLKRGKSREHGSRLFFVTDVHGSDRCFKKFLNAGRFYGVDYLILGGDITGKTLVPIETVRHGWRARYGDHSYDLTTEHERLELEQLIRDNGEYPIVGERDELMLLDDERHRERVFTDVVVANIRHWVELAEERLHGTGVRCFVTPGNDDFFEIDEPLQSSDVVEFVEGRCVHLDEHHEMITTGYSNPTPWETPRELDENELLDRIEAMYADVESPESLVAVLHAPPRSTELDQAPAIDSEFRVQVQLGGVKYAAVGSSAVREFIERRQPLLGLHGHVHESKAAQLLGRTLCINPGSEYTEGTLVGVLVTLGDNTVLSHQFVTG
jgi:uncharacterized protein